MSRSDPRGESSKRPETGAFPYSDNTSFHSTRDFSLMTDGGQLSVPGLALGHRNTNTYVPLTPSGFLNPKAPIPELSTPQYSTPIVDSQNFDYDSQDDNNDNGSPSKTPDIPVRHRTRPPTGNPSKRARFASVSDALGDFTTTQDDSNPVPDLKDWTYGTGRSFSGARQLSEHRHSRVTQDLALSFLQRDLDDGSTKEGLALYHDDRDGSINETNLIDDIDSPAELVTAVAAHPKEWFTVLSKYCEIGISATADLDRAAHLLEAATAANTDAQQARLLAESSEARINERYGCLDQQFQGFKTNYDALKDSKDHDDKCLNKARDTLNRLRKERGTLRNNTQRLQGELLEIHVR
jgi:hypothetical protein